MFLNIKNKTNKMIKKLWIKITFGNALWCFSNVLCAFLLFGHTSCWFFAKKNISLEKIFKIVW